MDSATLTDAKMRLLLLNESSWLNLYMYPGELDYEADYRSQLDKTRWIRVDALVRPTLNLSTDDNDAVNRLESWRRMKEKNTTLKLIYVSLGTVVSEDMNIMEMVMNQVIKCLQRAL